MKNENAAVQKLLSVRGSPPVPPRNFQILFAVHAALTLAAGIVLIAAPELIPDAVGIQIETKAYLICYLLAAAELSFAVLSWSGRKLTDAKALRVLINAFIVFHAASGILETYAFAKGASAALWGNIVLRAVVVFLFVYFGLYKLLKINAQTAEDYKNGLAQKN